MLRFNENNEILKDDDYRAIIVGLQWKSDISRAMDELEGLCQADGINVCGRAEQPLDRPNTATYIGKGKVEELALLCENMGIDTVVFNDELSGIQIRNLEEALGVRVIDRTILILDIFADRATSKEGKLQVELAQLQYRMPRLTGFGKSLSRLGGGIGTRGPGEKKLETDRRHIQARIDDIKAELLKASKIRNTQKTERVKSGIPVVALVGYTNSGKSAIMNRLIETFDRETQGNEGSKRNSEKQISGEPEALMRTQSLSMDKGPKTVKSQDMLFATLDTAHRKISISKGMDFVLIDTVGFVSGLPHNLVEAFKSTLEEVQDADLLIHVVDSSRDDEIDFQIDVTNKVIDQLRADNKKAEMIMAYNKIDIAQNRPIDGLVGKSIFLSAKTGEGMDNLVTIIKESIYGDMVEAKLLIPYDKGSIVSYICDNGQITSMDYREDGTLLIGKIKHEDYDRYKQFKHQD